MKKLLNNFSTAIAWEYIGKMYVFVMVLCGFANAFPKGRGNNIIEGFYIGFVISSVISLAWVTFIFAYYAIDYFKNRHKNRCSRTMAPEYYNEKMQIKFLRNRCLKVFSTFFICQAFIVISSVFYAKDIESLVLEQLFWFGIYFTGCLLVYLFADNIVAFRNRKNSK